MPGDEDAAVYVEVVGDDADARCRAALARAHLLHEAHAVGDVLHRAGRGVLLDDAIRVYAAGDQIVGHAPGLRPRLVGPLPAGDHADRLLVRDQVVKGSVEPMPQHDTWPVLAHLRAEDDDVVEVCLALLGKAGGNRTFDADEKHGQDTERAGGPVARHRWNSRPEAKVARQCKAPNRAARTIHTAKNVVPDPTARMVRPYAKLSMPKVASVIVGAMLRLPCDRRPMACWEPCTCTDYST